MKFQILLDGVLVGEADSAEAARQFVRYSIAANADRTLAVRLEIRAL